MWCARPARPATRDACRPAVKPSIILSSHRLRGSQSAAPRPQRSLSRILSREFAILKHIGSSGRIPTVRRRMASGVACVWRPGENALERDEIRENVGSAIEAVAPGTDLQRIEPNRPLREQVDLDSLDWLNFIAALSERLKVPIPPSEYGQLETLNSAVDYLLGARARLPGRFAPVQAPDFGSLARREYLVRGTTVAVRPIGREDRELEADFVRHLSTEARYKRFMVTLRELPEAKLKYLTDVDQIKHVALVAATQRDGSTVLLGVVRYVVDDSGTNCEFAIAIDDAWQGSGLGGILMHELMSIARGRGLKTMEGIVLANNARMLKFTHQLGFRGARDPEERDAVRVVRNL